jgi:hypothetical protein
LSSLGSSAVRALGRRTLAIPTSLQRTAQVPRAVSKAMIPVDIVLIILPNPDHQTFVAIAS